MIIKFLLVTGTFFLSLLRSSGKLVLFCARAVISGVRPPIYYQEIFLQIYKIGYLSLPVVGLTAFFTGGALALQIYDGGSRFNGENVVPSIVAIGMLRELGPVLGGLMVAGRVSSAIAAEIGTMKVTEQIDALSTLAIDPVRYLVFPRITAATVSMPFLVCIGNAIGIMGGYFVGVNRLGFNSTSYILNTFEFLTIQDLTSGLIKAGTFGFVIASMGCFSGFYSSKGAEGVGRAATTAVVSSSILILASNYLLTELLFKS
ncbi:MAG: ABC transporter permease [Pseudomonadota bacterium]|nr:ABC transporter permease [Pseudomonadota bacterium]